MKALWIVILIIVLIIAVFVFFNREEQEVLAPTETPNPETAETVRKQGELKDVSGGSSSGLAQTLFENGKFTHSVVALMPDSPADKFYEGWLVNRESGQVIDFFSTGHLIKEGGSYILQFEDDKDYPEHDSVIITLEEMDDKKPEKHILDGDLKLVE